MTNIDFLEAVFAAIDIEHERVTVCTFADSPDERRAWPVLGVDEAAHLFTETADANTYYTVSTCDMVGRANRRKDHVAALYVVPLDDVGTRVSVAHVPLPPSYAIETSPGNWQYGYLLDRPCTGADLVRGAGVVRAASAIADPSAATVTKLLRLPVGWNNKSKHCAPEPWRVRLTQWTDRRYTLDALAGVFGCASVPDARRTPVIEREVALRAPLAQSLIRAGLLHAGARATRGWYTIECPWGDEHTPGQPTTAGWRAPDGFHCFHSHGGSGYGLRVRAWLYARQQEIRETYERERQARRGS